MSSETEQPDVSFTSFRRRRVTNHNDKSGRVQQRKSESSSGSDSDQLLSIVKKPLKRKTQKNPLFQTSRKRERIENNEGSNSDNEDNETFEDSLHVAFPSSGTAERAGPSDMGATATIEIDTVANADAQAQFERVQQLIREKHDDKVYRGLAVYGAKEKKDTVWGNASSGLNRFGPVRAPNFVRQSVRWDFAPDICKDYKETGFCTFGDSCKFLHDRTDYKHGWEIERDYAAGKSREDDDKKYAISSEDEGDDDLPFKCFICREDFVNPVVTKCKHYFCEKCALKNHAKTPKCFICDENTLGIFRVAKELISKLKEMNRKNELESEVFGAEDNHVAMPEKLAD